MEEGPAIVLAIVIAGPIIVAALPAILPIAAVVHVIRRHRKKPPEHEFVVGAGTRLTYYTRDKTLLRIPASDPATP